MPDAKLRIPSVCPNDGTALSAPILHRRKCGYSYGLSSDREIDRADEARLLRLRIEFDESRLGELKEKLERLER